MSAFEQAWYLLKQGLQSTLPYEHQPGVDFKDSFRGLIDTSRLPSLPPYTSEKQPIPSQILVGDYGHQYRMIGDNNEELTTLGSDTYRNPDENNRIEVHRPVASTNPLYRRQGYYNRLLHALLASGRQFVSDERNILSQPFHEKFSQNLPPGIDLETFPHKRTPHYDMYRYTPNIPKFEGSDLAAYDIGAMPIRREPSLPSSPNSKQTSLADFQ